MQCGAGTLTLKVFHSGFENPATTRTSSLLDLELISIAVVKNAELYASSASLAAAFSTSRLFLFNPPNIWGMRQSSADWSTSGRPSVFRLVFRSINNMLRSEALTFNQYTKVPDSAINSTP